MLEMLHRLSLMIFLLVFPVSAIAETMEPVIVDIGSDKIVVQHRLVSNPSTGDKIRSCENESYHQLTEAEEEALKKIRKERIKVYEEGLNMCLDNTWKQRDREALEKSTEGCALYDRIAKYISSKCIEISSDSMLEFRGMRVCSTKRYLYACIDK